MKKVIKSLLPFLFLSVSIFSCSDDDDDDKTTLKTTENLRDAITGETGAKTKYLKFSEKAAEEGLLNISKLFEAAAAAENVHIGNHNRVLKALGEAEYTPAPPSVDVKATEENLGSGIEGETYEFETMYPNFIKDAQADKRDDAVKTFTWAKETEQVHAETYEYILSMLKEKGDDTEVPGKWYVCPICGNLEYQIDGITVCEFCGNPIDKFEIFE